MNTPFINRFKFNRNEKCSCGSGKKYKVCHLYSDQGWEKSESGNWVKKDLQNG